MLQTAEYDTWLDERSDSSRSRRSSTGSSSSGRSEASLQSQLGLDDALPGPAAGVVPTSLDTEHGGVRVAPSSAVETPASTSVETPPIAVAMGAAAEDALVTVAGPQRPSSIPIPVTATTSLSLTGVMTSHSLRKRLRASANLTQLAIHDATHIGSLPLSSLATLPSLQRVSIQNSTVWTYRLSRKVLRQAQRSGASVCGSVAVCGSMLDGVLDVSCVHALVHMHAHAFFLPVCPSTLHCI